MNINRFILFSFCFEEHISTGFSDHGLKNRTRSGPDRDLMVINVINVTKDIIKFRMAVQVNGLLCMRVAAMPSLLIFCLYSTILYLWFEFVDMDTCHLPGFDSFIGVWSKDACAV